MAWMGCHPCPNSRNPSKPSSRPHDSRNAGQPVSLQGSPETLVLCGVMREENIMHIKDLRPALVSCVGALAAALCCLLPLGVIALGLGSGVFMATTMRYQSMLLP